MSISAIILGAVATLAYALGEANDSSSDTRVKQAQLRSATMRIAELVRNSKLVMGNYANTLVLWRDTNGNGKVTQEELVFLKTDSTQTGLTLTEYDSTEVIGSAITPTTVQNRTVANQLAIKPVPDTTINIIPTCSHVNFAVNNAVIARSKSVTISFDIEINGTTVPYSLQYTLISPAFNLLSATNPPGLAISDDD